MQEVEQYREKSAISTMGEMRKAILAKVSTLEDTKQNIYDIFVTVHKEVVCVHGVQQWSKVCLQTLKNIDAAIAHVEERKIRYKETPLDLAKKMKP